jgi:hypothetical protein
MDRAARTHLLGFLTVLAVALVFHYFLLPIVVLPILGLRVPGGVRYEPIYWLALVAALVPVVLWLFPRFSDGLARATFEFHRRIFGRGGTYVRLPVSELCVSRTPCCSQSGPSRSTYS